MTRPWARVLVATLLASTGVVAIAMRAPSVEVAEVDARSFSADALVRPPAVVDCTLDNGNAARCVQVVVKYLPANLRIGPFCPSMVSEAGGIWNWDGPRAGLYRVDGDFLRMLQGLGYAFYDPHGRVHIADPGKGCPAAANACLEAALDTTVTMTILLPQTPVMATRASRLGVVNKVGLGLDGVPIFSDAPSVLLKGHMPALDTCGGHVDPGGWYHWHSTSSDMKTVYDRSPRQRGLWPSPVARGPVRLWLRRRADLWQRRPRPNDPHQSGCLQRSRRPDGSATGGHVSLPCHAPLSEPAGLLADPGVILKIGNARVTERVACW